ncbi:MAG: M15 family metallopeptidase [Propionibacteriales bacterium]|nr:M15 family metallopeptidase [Propionibacteriales bacterium]
MSLTLACLIMITGFVVAQTPPSLDSVLDRIDRPRGTPSPDGRPSSGRERRTGNRDARTTTNGALPDGATVSDTRYPGVANLDPALLKALQKAVRDADDGTTLVINSGWRSADYQDQLLREAVATYGSATEAARWVATADTSPHVSGDAVDIGPPDVASWLATHGAARGLCRIYRNEPWHFELRASAKKQGCPAPYADPTQDPRMRG